ncbi:transposase-like protein, IS1381 ISSpn7 [Streptococcus pneumoniae]|nr:transposase-like protein, IS1381 ISSpn7 [Streptococcus pneumoniae]
MNDEASKQLTDARFKRLVGVQRTTFEEMLAVLKTAYQLKHAKGGRKPKLSLEDLLMATLQYGELTLEFLSSLLYPSEPMG